MIIKLLKLLFGSATSDNHQPQRHVVNGKVYTEENRGGFLYLKDTRGFVTPMKDEYGRHIKADR